MHRTAHTGYSFGQVITAVTSGQRPPLPLMCVTDSNVAASQVCAELMTACLAGEASDRPDAAGLLLAFSGLGVLKTSENNNNSSSSTDISATNNGKSAIDISDKKVAIDNSNRAPTNI